MSELIINIKNDGTDAHEIEEFLCGELIKTPAELSVIVYRKKEDGQDLSVPPEVCHLWGFAYRCLQIILEAGICERMNLIKAIHASTAWANEDRTEMTLTWLDQ
jgi:hypothetical protein